MSRVFSPSWLGSDLVKRQKAFTKNDLIKTKILFRSLFLFAFAAILSLFYIWTRVQVVQYAYEINDLKAKQSLLLEQNKKLKVEIATLSSPQWIENIATTKLEMVPFSKNQLKIVTYTSEGLVVDEFKGSPQTLDASASETHKEKSDIAALD